MNKKKILWLSDFNCATGLATVAHNIVEQLLQTEKYEFEIVGVNYYGEPYDFKKWPFPIYPARDLAKAAKNQIYADPFGRPRFMDLLKTGKYDIAVTLLDTFIMEMIAGGIKQEQKHAHFKWLFYYAVDGRVKDSWINRSALLADIPVTYTHYGREETRRINPDANPQVIYLGVNTRDFYPLTDITAFRSNYFGDNANKFIVTNVNRNQPRKDIPRTIAAFAKFQKLRPASFLYLHMNPIDVGGNVWEMARYWGLRPHVDFMTPAEFDASEGYPVDVLNKIYNASDVIVSTTLGEGWGLTVTEAMATKTPVIIPDNTALSEIGAAGRARLVKSGRDFICLGAMDSNQYRPLTDMDDMVEALIDCHDHREKYRQMADTAFDWVSKLSWETIGRQWIELLETASTSI